jgi:glutamyl-tRNA synthetase
MDREEIIESFSLDRINKTSAIFDHQKLDWMNGEYIGKLDDESLLNSVIPFFKHTQWFDTAWVEERREYLIKVLNLLKGRAKRLGDFVPYASYFFIDVLEYEEKGVKKHFVKDTPHYLNELISKLQETDDFSKEHLEPIFRESAERLNIKAAQLIHPVRLATTGMTVGPGLFEILEVLGKEIVIKRLTKASHYIKLL